MLRAFSMSRAFFYAAYIFHAPYILSVACILLCSEHFLIPRAFFNAACMPFSLPSTVFNGPWIFQCPVHFSNRRIFSMPMARTFFNAADMFKFSSLNFLILNLSSKPTKMLKRLICSVSRDILIRELFIASILKLFSCKPWPYTARLGTVARQYPTHLPATHLPRFDFRPRHVCLVVL